MVILVLNAVICIAKHVLVNVSLDRRSGVHFTANLSLCAVSFIATYVKWVHLSFFPS